MIDTKEWGDKLEALGLMPSSTGEPGGKRVGDCMADYPIEGGLFLASCERLATRDYRISWFDRFPTKHIALAADGSEVSEVIVMPAEDEPQKQTRAKFTCPQCQANAWGKPSLNIICGDCEQPFIVV